MSEVKIRMTNGSLDISQISMVSYRGILCSMILIEGIVMTTSCETSIGKISLRIIHLIEKRGLRKWRTIEMSVLEWRTSLSSSHYREEKEDDERRNRFLNWQSNHNLTLSWTWNPWRPAVRPLIDPFNWNKIFRNESTLKIVSTWGSWVNTDSGEEVWLKWFVSVKGRVNI